MEPPKKTTFPPEFLMLFTQYIYTNHNHISGKKYKLFVPFQNGGQVTNFHFASFRFRAKLKKKKTKKKKKKHFPKRIFYEIWLKLGDHKYINIPEIKFG